ncbi:MAG: hydroxymethylglutaryl-CoA synthase [Chloroflexi bacterium]|nr:hydroxymethylglutaryl-CoA synthase [Chloroflexota bacterium]MBU1750295.1 hydroxymethylglutaryl-CoA synthase [Chloroflexota bacterium]
MKPKRDVGIVGYGAYVPRFRIAAAEIARVWQPGQPFAGKTEKSVPGPDEDTVTIAIEAARNAVYRAQVSPRDIRAVWVGTESKPYAVKPTSTIVAEAIGATPEVSAADWEFACKAGTEAMQAAIALVGSEMANYAMAIGADVAQGRPGDPLEYNTGAGGAAFIIGPAAESVAQLEASYSYVTDTPDFFRRQLQEFPEHGHRFTGEPAYFKHVEGAAQALMAELGYQPQDFALAVFHQPNVKFPQRAAQSLGFSKEQIGPGLLAGVIGNTYAAATMLGLTAALDHAKPGDRILCVSYGSGAGSDAFSFVVTDVIEEKRDRAPRVQEYIDRKKMVDYATYARYTGRFGKQDA